MDSEVVGKWTRILLGLIRRASTELPGDVVAALESGREAEARGCGARSTMDTLIENVRLAGEKSVPMCQDTGTLTFWFEVPEGGATDEYAAAARAAVREATSRGWLRLNVIDVPSGSQVHDNVGEGNPTLHFSSGPAGQVRVQLLMKGGGCENMSRQYSLPDMELGAGRDLEGVRRCMLDAVWRAQGNGCAPGILGVCIGGDRANGFAKAKEQLLRPLGDESPQEALAELERRVMQEANTLGIGPMGLGGRTTLLGVKVGTLPRLPASYFVTVSYGCWATRRAEVVADPEGGGDGA